MSVSGTVRAVSSRNGWQFRECGKDELGSEGLGKHCVLTFPLPSPGPGPPSLVLMQLDFDSASCQKQSAGQPCSSVHADFLIRSNKLLSFS